jgi:hypothetical protein
MPRRRKPMLSGTALSRGARMARKPMRAKPHQVGPAEREARRLVAARSGGVCEGCGRVPATDYAHRIARSQGGPWDAANAVHLCHEEHMWAHAEPEAARRFGWSVRRGHDYRTTRVWTAAHGWILLASDGTYTTTEKRAAA